MRLYVGVRFYRWYDCDDGVRRQFKGRVAEVTSTNLGGGEMTTLLKILWFNGGNSLTTTHIHTLLFLLTLIS